MTFHVSVRIHRHEGHELQEAWIHLPAGSEMTGRHGRDEMILEPRIGLLEASRSPWSD